jgi:hypothetical protein
VRGIVALAFLERIEAILRQRAGGDPAFRLSDHFHLIGGTSTGAIIATGLALGMAVDRLIAMYLDLASAGFTGSRWHGGIFVPKFKKEALLFQLRRQLGNLTLGSPELRTYLAIIAKRLDTQSIWIFHNNPNGAYFGLHPDDPDAVPNRDLELANLIRASCAAPTYFAPEILEVARGLGGAFVDGGVSPHANPALALLLMATLRGYGFHWPMGPDRLQICSIGTGHGRPSRGAAAFARMTPVLMAAEALYSVIDDCSDLAQTVLQWLGTSPTLWSIDKEIGDLRDDNAVPGGLFRYLRYDVVVAADWLRAHLDLDLTATEIDRLVRMDEPANTVQLLEIGRLAAARQVQPEHLG